jgi:hypothetical protein
MSVLLPLSTNHPLAVADQGAPLPLTLQPNERRQVKVSIHLTGLPAGPFSKTVDVYVRGSSRPAALLRLSGILQPNLTLAPPVLDFGRVTAGSRPALILTAAFGERLAAITPSPRLVGQGTQVEITPLKDPLPPTIRKTAGKTSVRPRLQRYRVTLRPDLEAGPLAATLTFVPGQPVDTQVTAAIKPSPNLEAALRQAGVMVVGEIVGTVRAQPSVLAFGSITAGQAPTRQIVLRADKPAALQNLKIETDSSWLMAKSAGEGALSPLMAAGRAAGASSVVNVTLSAQAPAGLLRASLTITLVNGERLSLPVQAYILSKTP